MDIFQKCHFDTLDKVRQMDIYPYFHVLESRQAPVVQMEGKRVIMLGSNNYLGFTEDEHHLDGDPHRARHRRSGGNHRPCPPPRGTVGTLTNLTI